MKIKKTITFLALLVSILAGYFSFLIASVIAYLITKKFSAKREGEKSLIKPLRFYFGEYYLHIHHWLLSLIITITPFTWKFIPNSLNQIALGALAGFAWQGIYCYKDWYKILGKRK